MPSAAEWSRDFVQIVGLEPEFWQNAAGEPTNFVKGERGDASAAAMAEFEQALANPQRIGVICSEYSHGDPFAGDSGRPCFSPVSCTAFAEGRRSDPLFSMFSFAVCDPFAPSAKRAAKCAAALKAAAARRVEEDPGCLHENNTALSRA